MKQLLQSYRAGKLWLAEVPAPACGRGGTLVRTRFSLISAGTERMLLNLARKTLIAKAVARPDLVKQVLGRCKTEGVMTTARKVLAKLEDPISLGYSAAGDVIEAGSSVSSLQPGDRVAIGGAGYATHAEFNSVPENLCAKIPEGVSYADAAFATLGAIALQGVRQAEPLLGERIVVVGLGLLGLLTVQILKANGCAVLGVDVNPRRVDLARKLGADDGASTVPEKCCAAFSGGRGADAVIITAATPSNGPIESAAEMSRHKGRIVVVGLVGMNVPREAFYRKELDLRLSTSYGPGRYDASYEEGGQDYPFAYVRFTEQRNMESFLYLVQQGRITPSELVTHRLAFEDALSAYDVLDGQVPKNGSLAREPLGILLEYPSDAPCARTLRVKQRRVEGSANEPLGIGFIGAGAFAKAVLLPQLGRIEGIDLTGVCTSTGKSAQLTASRFDFEFTTTDPIELFDHERTQAVFVATRHASHAELTCLALRAGKHVFVEKPLCLRESELDEIEEALAAAREAGHEPCLMVGFNRRFSPHTSTLREAFQGRSTPMVVSYRVNAGRVPADSWIQDPEESGGRVLGEGVHFIDFCGALIESPPNVVTAMSVAAHRYDVVAQDSVVITILYADGSLATVQYLAEGSTDMPKERCEVFADGKTAVMDDFRTTKFFGGGKALRGRPAKGFAQELKTFLERCGNGGPWPISWQSLVATHRVGFAALESLNTGAPVRLGVAG